MRLPFQKNKTMRGATATFFKKTEEELTLAETKVDCRNPSRAKASVGNEENRYWQSQNDDDEIDAFIHFDSKSRVLTVCQKRQGDGRPVAGRSEPRRR